jgi:uncharacterized protein (TIGR00255 family)
MTGFGKAAVHAGERGYVLELRSYNHRFLDPRARLPWPSAELEHRLLMQIRKRLARGRVDLVIRQESGAGGAARLRVDADVARALARAMKEIEVLVGCDNATAAALVGQPRELVTTDVEAPDATRVWAPLSQALDEALEALIEMRRREGEALRVDLEGHMDELHRLVESVRRQVADEPARHRARLRERLGALAEDVTMDPQRIEQEVALAADRCDVSEELARLESHLRQMRDMAAQQGPVGRKLEFMLQEVNRELSTIGAKTLSADVSHLIVEGKATVEKMREQVQNVE